MQYYAYFIAGQNLNIQVKILNLVWFSISLFPSLKQAIIHFNNNQG